MQKIVLVSNTAWAFFKFRRNLIKFLIEKGFEVTLIAAPDEHVEGLENLGATFVKLKHLESKGKSPFKDLRLLMELRKLYKTIKPDFLIHYTIKPNIYGSLIARRLNISSIAVVTGLGYTFINKGLIPFIAKILYKISFKAATEVWFLNEEDKNLFIENKIVDTNKIFLLNGEGINCEEFNPVKLNHVKKSDGSISFILIARMLYDKGVNEYVEAAKIVKSQYPAVSFNLLGYLNVENPSAVSEKQMKKWVDEGFVNYLGHTENVKPYILENSCVVLPSYREGMSMILMESAALGKPLIATDIPGCKQLIDDNITGFLCKPKDGKDLANKMLQMILLSDNARQVMGQLGRHKMETEFDEKITLQTYFERIQQYL